MTYKFDVTTSHQRLRAHAVQVKAGLTAVPELAPKASDWDTQRLRVIEHRTAWEDGQDALTVAQTINRVRIYPPRTGRAENILAAAAPVIQNAPQKY